MRFREWPRPGEWAHPTRRRGLVALVAAITALAGVLAVVGVGQTVVEVTPDQSITEIAAAHPGAVLDLRAGRYASFSLDTAVTVRGGDDVTVAGPVRVRADGARVEDLRVRGGSVGITVREADGVALDGVDIRGTGLHGIEVVDATAVIQDCGVAGLREPQAQAVEIRNAAGRGRTRVIGCAITGGREGIVTHASRAEIRANHVTGTGVRAIAVMEMSEGLIEANTVQDVTGAGLYCGDMSHCEAIGNTVRGVTDDGSGVTSRSGLAAVSWYHSAMRLEDNTFQSIDAEPATLAFQQSTFTDDSPLAVWAPGWAGALPAVPVAAVGLLVLVAVRAAAGRFLPRLVAWSRARRGRNSVGRRPASADEPTRGRRSHHALLVAVAGGLGVQSFHMFEHMVQVWQVYVTESASHAGILGQQVNTEWVHLTFNLAILVLLGVLWREARDVDARFIAGAGAAWTVAAIAVQSWHVVEHVAKTAQHVTRGVAIGPGLLGDDLGLVWFHFGINLAVYVGTVIAVAMLVSTLRHLIGGGARREVSPAVGA